MRLSRAAHPVVLVCLLALTASPALTAQSTEADITSRLVHKPLFLRGLWEKNNLKFDSRGSLVGKPKLTVFSLAGIDVSDVELSAGALNIHGKRVGIRFDNDIPNRIPLNDTITISVEKPSTSDFTEALNAIFADRLDEVTQSAPDYWQWYLASHVPPPGAQPLPPDPPPIPRPAPTVTPPEVIWRVGTELNSVVRSLKYSGTSTVRLLIDPSGRPTKLRVVRAAGLGMDEHAVAAVSQYRFRPATDHGTYVPVQVNVEVNFDTR